MSIEIPDDDVRIYSPEEIRRLSRNLEALVSRTERGEFSGRRFSVEFIDELHASLFEGVRDHAGRHRREGSGSERLVFGPIASVDRRAVPRELERLGTEMEKGCDQVGSLEGPPRGLAAIRHAALMHAKFIKIHPFEDGNGRVGRVLMSIVLVRLGLRPIAVEVPKQEYIRAINAHHEAGDIEPLLDLLLRLAAAD